MNNYSLNRKKSRVIPSLYYDHYKHLLLLEALVSMKGTKKYVPQETLLEFLIFQTVQVD
jgi:hypothetical protein